MIVLDTNVLSALMRATPSRTVIQWLDQQSRQSVWTTSVNVYEVHFGLETMAQGRKRAALQACFEQLLVEDLSGRVLEFDSAAAQAAARISSRLRSIGRPVEVRDAMIAGIIDARRAVLATRNVRHFDEAQIKIVDPWAEQPEQ